MAFGSMRLASHHCRSNCCHCLDCCFACGCCFVVGTGVVVEAREGRAFVRRLVVDCAAVDLPSSWPSFVDSADSEVGGFVAVVALRSLPPRGWLRVG